MFWCSLSKYIIQTAQNKREEYHLTNIFKKKKKKQKAYTYIS